MKHGPYLNYMIDVAAGIHNNNIKISIENLKIAPLSISFSLGNSNTLKIGVKKTPPCTTRIWDDPLAVHATF